MTKRMLIDATHAEETRVAVVDGNRMTDFDYESQVRKQLKGSIFLAKVTRVEPSLQAAFVNFGGNRHGFLPFTEIHPDYFRIPIADREAILAEQEREMEARLAEEEAADSEDEDHADDEDGEEADDPEGAEAAHDDDDAEDTDGDAEDGDNEKPRGRRGRGGRKGRGRGRGRIPARSRRVETVGGDGIEGDQPLRPSLRRNYKIQEVVKRGQIMLIQVSKEERGNKGAAVTTYLSLPGRYCVLMPNSPRAGGVSRKIANYKERRRMRDILNELKVPQGMSVIMRTAGTSRTKAEIKRDLDYLMKLWDDIRELTLESTAPALIHEEDNLIRRSIRDIYTPDIEDVLVAGEESYKFAKNFMKMMIPSHAKKVQNYKEDQIPLFHRYQVESQINEIGDPVVTLPSGGYLVINPTEALVSIDVNSGKATKERHIEETALRTNLESAQEVARQLRLRDLGGLVVIDFIDMEDRRNNRKVENKLKEALSNDRARIQIGRISNFGLLELSRQRLNPSLTEAQFEKCPHCLGMGVVRTIDAAAIAVLRALEEEGIKGRAAEIKLHIPNQIALYLLNNKRHRLAEIEQRFGFTVMIHIDEALAPARFLLEPLKADGGVVDGDDTKKAVPEDDGEDRQDRGGRRRRGRRGGRRRGSNDRAEGRDNDGAGDESGETTAESVSDSGQQGDDQETDKAKKGKAKPSRAKTKKAARDDTADDQADEKKPRPGRKKKDTADEPKDDSKDAKDKKKTPAKKPAAKRTPARKKAAAGKSDKGDKDDDGKADAAADPAPDVAVPAPSNDVEEARDYETVNEPPQTKKKGWWNKLVD